MAGALACKSSRRVEYTSSWKVCLTRWGARGRRGAGKKNLSALHTAEASNTRREPRGRCLAAAASRPAPACAAPGRYGRPCRDLSSVGGKGKRQSQNTVTRHKPAARSRGEPPL